MRIVDCGLRIENSANPQPSNRQPQPSTRNPHHQPSRARPIQADQPPRPRNGRRAGLGRVMARRSPRPARRRNHEPLARQRARGCDEMAASTGRRVEAFRRTSRPRRTSTGSSRASSARSAARHPRERRREHPRRQQSLSEADWDTVIDTNVKGPFLLARALGPRSARGGDASSTWGRFSA